MAADNSSRLPEKEYIAPNQHSWPETAARMEENHGKKRPCGKVDSTLTAQHIGVPNRKRATNNDPYGAGEQSGKRTKPDVRSAAANDRACAVPKAELLPTLPPTLLPSLLLPLPPPIPPPTPLPTPRPPPASPPFPTPFHASHSPYTHNPYYFHPPLSQPVYSHS